MSVIQGVKVKIRPRLRTWTVNFYDGRSMCQCFTKFLNPPGKKKRKKKKKNQTSHLERFPKNLSSRPLYPRCLSRGYSAIISFIKQTVRLISFKLESTDEGELEARGDRSQWILSGRPIKNSWPIDKPIMCVYNFTYIGW